MLNPRDVRAKGDMYPVIEMFTSVQSEGHRAGTLNHFLRLGGCNSTSCPFCDTDLNTYKMMSAKDIVAELHRMEAAMSASYRLVITGGEPMVHNLGPLFTLLGKYPMENSFYVAMESNGSLLNNLSLYQPEVLPRINWLTISPKSSVSRGWIDRWASEVKYVIPDHEDLIETIFDHVSYFVQPEFNNPDSLARCVYLMSLNPKLRLSVQSHKYLGLR